MLSIFSRPRKDLADHFAFGISFILIILCACYLAFFCVFVHKHFKRLDEPEFRRRFLGLYDGLNTKTRYQASANLVWLLRGLLLVLIIFALEDFPKLQTSLFFCLAATMQLYLIIALPYKSLVDNVLQVFNESGLIVLAVSYFFFTDMTLSIESKQRVGHWLIGAVLFGVAVNSAFILLDVVSVFFKKKNDVQVLDTNREDPPDRTINARDEILAGNYNTTSYLRNETVQPI